MSESNTQDTTSQDAEFDAAWAELSGDGTPSADDDGQQAAQAPEQAGDEPEAEGADDAQQDDAAQEAEAEQQEQAAADDGNPAEDLERIRHDLKTWQGRERKARELAAAEEARLEQLRREAEELERKRQELAAAMAGGDAKDESGETAEGESPDDVLDEFREIADPILKKAEQLVAEKLTPLEQAQQAAQEQLLQAAREAFDRQVQAAHPDYFDIVQPAEGESPLVEWVQQRPFAEAVEWQRVMQEGTAQEVVELLNAYKSTTQGGSGGSSRKGQLDAATTIRRGASGAPPRTAAPPRDDFDATWDAITN